MCIIIISSEEFDLLDHITSSPDEGPFWQFHLQCLWALFKSAMYHSGARIRQSLSCSNFESRLPPQFLFIRQLMNLLALYLDALYNKGESHPPNYFVKLDAQVS